MAGRPAGRTAEARTWVGPAKKFHPYLNMWRGREAQQAKPIFTALKPHHSMCKDSVKRGKKPKKKKQISKYAFTLHVKT